MPFTIFISSDLDEHSLFYTALKEKHEILAYSLIEFAPISFDEIPQVDYIFFYSKNAIKFFVPKALGYFDLKETHLCCMGEGTAKVLRQFGFEPKFIGNGKPTEIANEFLSIVRGKKILFPRAKYSRKSIQALIKDKAIVFDLVVYENLKKQSFDHPNADILVFTSPLNAESYFDNHEIRNEYVISIGSTTQKKLEELGIKNIIIAESPSEKGMVTAIKKIIDSQ